MKPLVLKRWLLPVAVALASGGLILVFISSSVRVAAPIATIKREAVPSGITIVGTRETNPDADLFALEPLFLPTSHNTSVLALPPRVRREPGSMDFSFPPKYTISDSAGAVPMPDPISVPARPIEALHLGEHPDAVPEVGRVDIYVPDLPPRLAFVEVSEAKSGRIVLAESVGAPETIPVLLGDWGPVEFIVGIDSAGLVGAPIVANSQSSEDVESFFRDFLSRQFQLGARLSPGLYAVRVGP